MISAPLYFSPVLFWTKGSYSCGSKTHKGDGVFMDYGQTKRSPARPRQSVFHIGYPQKAAINKEG